MEQAFKEHQPRFIERWSNAEIVNAKLGVTLILMSFICLILIFSLVYAALKPRAIYYIPNAKEAGVAFSNQMPEGIVSNFTASWVLNWANFSPVTVSDVYARAERFMSPALFAHTQARLKKDIDEVKTNNISSLFSLTEDPQVQSQSRGHLVTIKGEKAIYVRQETISTQNMVYKVSVRAVSPTQTNPYGLMIDAIEQEVITPSMGELPLKKDR